MVQAVSRRPLTAKAPEHPSPIRVEFVVDKVALGQVFLRVLRFFPVSIIPPMLLLSWRYDPLWLYFHSPVAGFSLLVFEVS